MTRAKLFTRSLIRDAPRRERKPKMMTINISNGECQFHKWIFSPNLKINEIKKSFSSKEFEPWTPNDQWTTYRLNISEQYIVLIMFFEESIKFIEIYPKNNNETGRANALQQILQNLSGESNYSWGKIG